MKHPIRNIVLYSNADDKGFGGIKEMLDISHCTTRIKVKLLLAFLCVLFVCGFFVYVGFFLLG